MLKTRLFVSLLILCLAIPVILRGCEAGREGGAVYYVSADGDDGNRGTLHSPWRTVNYAMSTQSGVSAGDWVYLREGIYLENVQVQISGAADNPIKVHAYPGETPVIDASRGDSHGFYIPDDSNHLEVKGLTVRNARVGSGIAMFKGDFITIDGCTVYGSSNNGIVNTGAGSSQIIIQNCSSHDNGSNGIYLQDVATGSVLNNVCYANGTGPDGGSGIEINDSDNVTVRGNACYSNSLAGIDIAGELNKTVVDQNVCYDNGGAGIQVATSRGAGPKDTVLTRNVCYANVTRQTWGAGIWIGRNATNTQVSDNISYDNGGDANIGVSDLVAGPVTVKNNVTSAHPTLALFVAGGVTGHVTEDDNCFHEARVSWGGETYTDLATYRASTGQGLNSQWINPLLADPANGNFALSDDSPCLDAGQNAGLGYDNP